MVTREQAVELFHKYNKSESLWHHALCVEAVMRAFAAETGHGIDLPIVIAFVGADLRHPHQLSVEQHILRFRDLPEDCRPVKDLLQGLLDQSRDQLRFMAFNGCFHRSFLYPQEPGGSLFLFYKCPQRARYWSKTSLDTALP